MARRVVIWTDAARFASGLPGAMPTGDQQAHATSAHPSSALLLTYDAGRAARPMRVSTWSNLGSFLNGSSNGSKKFSGR